jgi:orotate phosphoribosyltransferase
MTADEVVQAFESSGALLKGHFELRSGLHSGDYFQCANALRYPRLAERLCRALVEKARAGGGEAARPDAVISPALGGLIVGHEVARALDVPFVFVEKQDGRLAMRRFAIRSAERYLVAEDVVTRGGRVQETIDIVQAAGGVVTAVATLVDRSGGKARFCAPLFSLLRMEPLTYAPADCPLCRAGQPLRHPGS